MERETLDWHTERFIKKLRLFWLSYIPSGMPIGHLSVLPRIDDIAMDHPF